MAESDKFKQMFDKYFNDDEPIEKEWEQSQFIKFLSEDIYRFQIMANHDSSFKDLTRNLGCFFCETPISTENVYFRCQNLKSLQYISMHRSCTYRFGSSFIHSFEFSNPSFLRYPRKRKKSSGASI